MGTALAFPLLSCVSMPSNQIRVLLVDDHVILRDGMKMVLESAGGIEVLGEANSGREGVELSQQLHPDVVVMDISMPLLNGFEATRQIRQASPGTRVLAMSAHADERALSSMAEVGASGYLLKNSTGKELVEAIRAVAAGNMYFSEAIADKVENTAWKLRHGQPSPVRRLSSREGEVLQLIAEGQANKQIASELKISIKTVEKHRQQLMLKLGIHDIAGLTRYAIATGVVENDMSPPSAAQPQK
jgi:DNA-binding NarL/FixJ family response regulator